MTIGEIIFVYFINTLCVLYMVLSSTNKRYEINWKMVTAALLFTIVGTLMIRVFKNIIKEI